MMYTNVGRKVVLWDEQFRNDAYKDQFGQPHPAYVVVREFVVTITEERDVKGTWGGSIVERGGWKGVAEDGTVFTCNWNYFPDDSATPSYYWDARVDNGYAWMPVDAEQAFGLGFLHVNPDGTLCVPALFEKCEKHNTYHMQGEKCWRCEAGI